MSSTTTSPVPAPAPARRRAAASWHFARHYLEMLVAMAVGMVGFGWLEGFLPFDLMARVDLGALVMATNMSVGMSAWMRFRSGSWRGTGVMSATMYLPFLALLVPYWAGGIPAGAVLPWGHVLMLPAMGLAMLVLPAEHPHRA